MHSVWVVYKTDSHHSYASRDVIGIATEQERAISLCQLQAAKEHQKITKDQLWNLKNLKQSQGYSGTGEFQYEEMKTDILL